LLRGCFAELFIVACEKGEGKANKIKSCDGKAEEGVWPSMIGSSFMPVNFAILAAV
jgi:hypothetical protein